MPITIQHDPTGPLNNLMEFLRGFSERKRGVQEQQRQIDYQQDAGIYGGLGAGINQGVGAIFNAELGKKYGTDAASLQSSRLAGQDYLQKQRTFQRQYGATPESVISGIPQAQPGQGPPYEGGPNLMGPPAPGAGGTPPTPAQPPASMGDVGGVPMPAINPASAVSYRNASREIAKLNSAIDIMRSDPNRSPGEISAAMQAATPRIQALQGILKRSAPPDMTPKFFGPDGQQMPLMPGVTALPNGGSIEMEPDGKVTYKAPTKSQEAQTRTQNWMERTPDQREEYYRAHIGNYDSLKQQGYGFKFDSQTGDIDEIKPATGKSDARGKAWEKTYSDQVKLIHGSKQASEEGVTPPMTDADYKEAGVRTIQAMAQKENAMELFENQESYEQIEDQAAEISQRVKTRQLTLGDLDQWKNDIYESFGRDFDEWPPNLQRLWRHIGAQSRYLYDEMPPIMRQGILQGN